MSLACFAGVFITVVGVVCVGCFVLVLNGFGLSVGWLRLLFAVVDYFVGLIV